MQMEISARTKNGKNGRWTKSEHDRFVDALELYGRNWAKIHKKVKTRTLAQIRSHAQKFFLQMSEQDIQAYLGDCDYSSQQEIDKNGKEQFNDCYEPSKAVMRKEKKKRRESMSSCCSSPKTIDSDNILNDLAVEDEGKICGNDPCGILIVSQAKYGENKRAMAQDVGDSDSMFIKIWKEHYSFFEKGGNFMDLISA